MAKQGPPEDDDDLNDTLSLRANLLMSQARRRILSPASFPSLAAPETRRGVASCVQPVVRNPVVGAQARQLRAFGVQFTSLAKDPKPVIEEGTELGGVAKARPWAQEEAARLRLALQKYPKGARRASGRWADASARPCGRAA